MIKSTVGHVRRTAYDLPDAKNPNHVYGYEIQRDPESAGEVIGKWVQAVPSPAAKSGRSFIETNHQAIVNGSVDALCGLCITAGETRKFANEHPQIVVKPVAKSKGDFVPTNSITYGIKSKASEDMQALIQARHTSFSTENADYPDLSTMKIKGKLPLPRDTRCSLAKDVRNHPVPQQRDHADLFKMTKFKNVGPVLSTQPNALSARKRGEEQYEADEGASYHGEDASGRGSGLMSGLLLALLLLDSECSSTGASASPLEVRGVAPADQATYQASEFACQVGGQRTTLPRDRVNDEYCDCDGGEDEPGTAACSHLLQSQFHCENGGFFPEKIHTSRIDDGICDCCDGSDEALAGSSPCPNTCTAAAESFRQTAQDRLVAVRAGFKKREAVVNGEIAAFFAGEDEAQASTADVLASLALLKERVMVHKDREELREKKFRLEVARQRQAEGHAVNMGEGGEGGVTSQQQFSDAAEKEAIEALEFEGLDAIRVADEDAPVDAAEDERASQLLDSNQQRVKSLVELPDGTRLSLAEYLRMDHTPRLPRTVEQMKREDFLGPLFNGDAEGRKKIGLYTLRTIGLVLSPIRGLVELVLFAPVTLWDVLSTPELAGAWIDRLPTFPSPTRSIWFRQVGGGSVYRAYSSVAWATQLDEDVTLPVAESLRKVLQEIDADVAKLEKERDAKQKAATMDYGPDHAFFALKDKCIEKRIEVRLAILAAVYSRGCFRPCAMQELVLKAVLLR
ncbi:hypothetical protein BBJ28_00009720 [Nothophytophthora sp. Chile5]|nr:hypothetical protein BBJ28_00009720 [Nothophytophthora sp. Chile5]